MEQTKSKNAFSAFCEKRGISLSPKFYFVDVMSAMALGLFASLLIGTIFGTLANIVEDYINITSLVEAFRTIESFAKQSTGMAIGVAIAYKMAADPLLMFSLAAVGAISNAMGAIITDGAIDKWAATAKGASGIFYSAGPAGAFFAVIIACIIGKLVSKRTKVDILVTPVVTLLAGFAVSFLICPVVSYIMYYLGIFISTATTFAAPIMGIVCSVVMGIVLTLPISSAAICSMIFSEAALLVATLNGTSEGFLLAGGAAAVGCCAQMVGFAVISFRENKWGGIVAQGLGTSMLQMGNIVKKPVIWVAPTLASAVTGLLSTTVFKIECTGVSAGMGTCGMVGPIGIFDAMDFNANSVIGVIVLCIVAPAVLSIIFNEIMRKLGWIKTGDMALDL